MDYKLSTFYLLILLSFLSQFSCRNHKLRSQLRFSTTAKGYTDILVGIGQDVADSDCAQVIQELQTTLAQTSSLLYSATEGKAHFSSVRILIQGNRCPSVNASLEATAGDSYASADLKVTNSHPLAKGLPWTRQYRGCFFGAEDIFIPGTNFLLNSAFSVREKGGLLLQEWAKFRYGIFEEFGNHEDKLYDACYKEGGQQSYLSSCSSTQLPPLFGGNGNCQSEIDKKKDDFLNRLNSNTEASSLMFMPHLSSISKFCDNATHNAHSPTKQNVFCGGQCVTHILESHPDFANSRMRENSTPRQLPVPQTTFRVIKQTNVYNVGLLIIIENSELIEQQNRLRYVKQSLASIVTLLPLDSMVGISFIDRPLHHLTRIQNDANRTSIIRAIPPDLANFVLEDGRKLDILPPLRQGDSIQLGDVIDRVLPTINGYASWDWQILLVTISPTEGYSHAVASLSGSPATLTVVTLDGRDDPRWMELYGSPNTRSIMPFPVDCTIQSEACAQWSCLIVEGLIDSIRQISPQSQWHKVGEATLPRGQVSEVTVDGLPPNGGNYTFFITMVEPLPSSLDQVVVRTPNGVNCSVAAVHGYQYLLGVGGCDIESGNWTVDLSRLSGVDAPCQVTVWVEATASTSLNILSSLGTEHKTELEPNGGVPVYARVSDMNDAPVISADVGVELFTSGGSVSASRIALKDDGIDPDVTQDDGIYSGFLTSFLNNPEFHLGRIQVETSTAQSRIVTSISSPKAALLDPRMTGKCCGSRVPFLTTSPLTNGRLTSFIPGFRTREGFNPGLLPPSRIGPITITEDDGQKIWLEFIAPGGSLGQGYLSHYETCCTDGVIEQTSSCHAVTPSSECVPAQPGTSQICVLTRSSLASQHVVSTGQAITVTLTCGLRGVNSQGLAGQVSMSSIVLEVITSVGPGGRTGECKSLSDDCLPISLFWGLIGCIGGLLLIILILIIFWCVWAHRRPRQQKKTTAREEVLLSTNKRRSRPDISHDIENPKNTQPTPSTLANNNNSQPPKESPLYNVYVNKAFISDGDGGMKLVAADGQLLPLDDPIPQTSSSLRPHHHRSHHTLPVLEDGSNNNPSKFGGVSIVQVPPVRRRSVPDHEMGLQDDMAIFKVRPQPPPKPARSNSQQRNSVPIPRNRVPRPESGYANANNSTQPGTTNNEPPKMPSGLDFPVYASVNRNGRSRTPVSSPPIPNLSSGFSTFRPSSATSPQRQGIPPHFGGRSKDDSFIPSSTRFTPKRYDAFPSSDSDTYSDMSRSVSMAPSLPPPQLPPFPPTTTNRASKPPPYNPPPPPPPHPHKKIEMQEDEYDDDSEHWDDDDFEFQTPGVSYA